MRREFASLDFAPTAPGPQCSIVCCTPALWAGVVAGLASAALQHVTTTPLIMAAEAYEKSESHASAGGVLQPSVELFQARLIRVHSNDEHSGHQAAAPTWAPEDGLERTLFTSVTTIASAFGFALMLLAAMLLSKRGHHGTNGPCLGCGRVRCDGPGAGTRSQPGSYREPPPPMSTPRQIWWLATAVVTAGGLWLALRISSPLAIAGAIVLICLPHIVGAPHPGAFTSAVPSELAGHFASASLVVHAVTWALVGVLLGFMWQRSERTAAAQWTGGPQTDTGNP